MCFFIIYCILLFVDKVWSMGQMGYNKTAGVSGRWSLIRDLTEPFRLQILSVLRFHYVMIYYFVTTKFCPWAR